MCKIIVEAIPNNFNIHPLDATLHLLYVNDMTKDYLLSEFDDSFYGKTVYTYDKKRLIQICPEFMNVNVVDIHFLTDEKIKMDFIEFPLYSFHYNKKYKSLDVNKFIQDIKHLEYCRILTRKYDHLLKLDVNKFYNDDFCQQFLLLERQSIEINGKFQKCIYNLHNTFSRPTVQSTSKINMNSLGKDSNVRENIKPINDLFVEFDYKNYQMKLLCDLIDVNMKGDVYTSLCSLYGTDDRDVAKTKTLYYCFSDIIKNPFPENEFYDSVFSLKRTLIENSGSYFNSPISGKNILLQGNGGDLSRILQVIETEKNVNVLKKIIEFCETKKTKPSLYTYDAFLIDYSEEDGDILSEIHDIISINGKVSVKIGEDYLNLKKVL